MTVVPARWGASRPWSENFPQGRLRRDREGIDVRTPRFSGGGGGVKGRIVGFSCFLFSLLLRWVVIFLCVRACVRAG